MKPYYLCTEVKSTFVVSLDFWYLFCMFISKLCNSKEIVNQLYESATFFFPFVRYCKPMYFNRYFSRVAKKKKQNHPSLRTFVHFILKNSHLSQEFSGEKGKFWSCVRVLMLIWRNKQINYSFIDCCLVCYNLFAVIQALYLSTILRYFNSMQNSSN